MIMRIKKASVIRPLSVVRLVKANVDTPLWKNQVGREFRVGYYNKKDGTDCVWLVNDKGEYEQTVEQDCLLQFFEIVQKSNERSFFGTNRPPLPALRSNGAVGVRKQRSRIHA